MTSRFELLPRRPGPYRRHGLIAISELLVLICILAGLLWLGSQLMASTGESLSATADTKSSSERCVYRISLDQSGKRLWVYRPREGLKQIQLATKEVEQSLPFSAANQLVVSHDADGLTTVICDMEGNVTRHRAGEETLVAQINSFNDMPVDASVHGNVALCLSQCGRIVGWKRDDSGVQSVQFALPAGPPLLRIRILSSGDRVAAARSNGVVSFHDSVTGAVAGPELNVGAECTSFAWSDDDRLLAFTTVDGHLRVMRLAEQSIICEANVCSVASARPTSLVISPDSRLIAVAMNVRKDIQLLNMESGEVVGNLIGHDGIVRTMQFGPGSDCLYSGSYDGTVREWSVTSKLMIAVLD
ncbi:MAG: hypothetical protein JSS49_18660 [Planctomycetes bacterium]|nr:hypothetical protein [Planctomycetota bacterium]